jgi:hypothetical protein
MASCEMIIAASSSYSWWGAYLAGHDNVCIPKAWMNRIPYSETELVVDGWKVNSNY